MKVFLYEDKTFADWQGLVLCVIFWGIDWYWSNEKWLSTLKMSLFSYFYLNKTLLNIFQYFKTINIIKSWNESVTVNPKIRTNCVNDNNIRSISRTYLIETTQGALQHIITQTDLVKPLLT